MSDARAHFETKEWESLAKSEENRQKLAVLQVQATSNVVKAIGQLAKVMR